MSKKTSKIKTVESLESCDCRWPIGDPRHADFHFCGAQQVLGRPYCSEHIAQAFDVAKSRPQINAKMLPFFRRAA
jgi:GcrA cell cycle regulator